jgi:hypothetical protein
MICDELVNELWRLDYLGDETWYMVYIGAAKIEPPNEFLLKTKDLPEWVKDRVAVVNMLQGRGLTEANIYGVGARIDDDHYWIVKPKELSDG